MFAMVESPRPSAGNAGPQLPAHRVMIPTFKRQKLDTFVPCTSFQAGKQQSIELSPRKNILRLESFSAMNPQPRTPNRFVVLTTQNCLFSIKYVLNQNQVYDRLLP